MRGIRANVNILCNIAEVSRSGYYKWLKHTDEPAKDYDDYLLIKEIFDKGKGKYGWRTIQMKLKSGKDIVMNHKKIIRIKNKYRNFKQTMPHQIFGTDITYLPFNHRMAYLSAVKDMACGEIVAWNISQRLTMDIVLNTVSNMKDNPSISSLNGVLIHSDQGFHYTNPEYTHMIKKLSMVQSMSRKGNCIDNAPTESFFGHLKDDVDYHDCKTFEELRKVIGNYVHYYNNERQQWDLKKMTPVEYRNHLLSTQK